MSWWITIRNAGALSPIDLHVLGECLDEFLNSPLDIDTLNSITPVKYPKMNVMSRYHSCLPVLFPLVTLLLVVGSKSEALGQTQDFSVPFQSVNEFRMSGVSFDYSINGASSSDAFVGSYGPGELVAVSDPSLTGSSSGILTLSFDPPTPILQFGVALSTGETLSRGFEVQLFDTDDQLLDTLGVPTKVLVEGPAFSEGEFRYDGAALTKAVISFADTTGDFAFDNLVVVPEPAGLTLAISGFALATLIRARRLASSPNR